MKTARIAGLAALFALALPGMASADRLLTPDIGLPEGFKAVQPHLSTVLGNEATTLGGFAYFVANDNIHGTELWRTNGESGGTTLVADLRPGAADSNPRALTVVGDRLYFNANDSEGSALGVFYLDAAAPNVVTQAQAARSNAPGSVPARATILNVVGGKAVVYRYTENQDYRLYALGASGSTFGQIPGTDSAVANQLFSPSAVIGDWMYFGKAFTNIGTRLWRTNGTTAEQITTAPIAPQDFVATSDRMYFTAGSDGHGRELWQSNPANPADTGIVYEHNANNTSTSIEFPGPVAVGNVLYYVPSNDPVTGPEVWRTEGTPGTTRIVKDLSPGAGGFAAQQVFSVGAGIGLLRGGGIYGSDGTDAGTALLAEADGDGYGPNNPISFGNTAYFVAGATPFGQALWRTDGTFFGTLPISAAGFDGTDATSGSPAVQTPIRLGNRLLFFARDRATNDTGFLKLFVLDRDQPDALRVSTAPPVITVLSNGARLDVSQGSWSGRPTKYAYQWLRNGQPIPGEIAQRTIYYPTAADAGQQISARVTTIGIGAPRFASADSAPVIGGAAPPSGGTKPPSGGSTAKTLSVRKKGKLAGKARVGRTLKLTLPRFSVSGVKVSIRWFANGKQIKKQTKAKLKLSKKLKGKRISAKVKVRKSGYKTRTITVGPTKKVKGR